MKFNHSLVMSVCNILSGMITILPHLVPWGSRYFTITAPSDSSSLKALVAIGCPLSSQKVVVEFYIFFRVFRPIQPQTS